MPLRCVVPTLGWTPMLSGFPTRHRDPRRSVGISDGRSRFLKSRSEGTLDGGSPELLRAVRPPSSDCPTPSARSRWTWDQAEVPEVTSSTTSTTAPSRTRPLTCTSMRCGPGWIFRTETCPNRCSRERTTDLPAGRSLTDSLNTLPAFSRGHPDSARHSRSPLSSQQRPAG